MTRWLATIVLTASMCSTSAGREPLLTVHGNNAAVAGAAGDFAAWLSGESHAGRPIRTETTDPFNGQWIARLEQAGVYTAAVEEIHGFGPILRPGIHVRQGEHCRVNLVLPLEYDFSDAAASGEQPHKEYGQSFTASGTGIIGITFRNAEGVQISLHENDLRGSQIGAGVVARASYPEGTLPTTPGRVYCLRFIREDGEPFVMPVIKNSGYERGSAYMDGRKQSDLDLAVRIQYNPSGQILRCKPGVTEVCHPARRSVGQTFVAKGTSLAMVSVFPAWDSASGQPPTIRFLQTGPGGPLIGSPVPGRMALFNPGRFQLNPGETYYIEIAAGNPEGGLRLWTSRSDDFGGGELYVDGSPVSGRDLAMILVEYEADKVVPSAPLTPSFRPGMPAVAQRYPSDRKARLVWDLPADNDIAGVTIHRVDSRRKVEEPEGIPIVKLNVSSRGRYQYVDAGIENGVAYQYLIRTVDVAGNRSEPLNAAVTARPGIPAAADLLNGDFSGPTDAGVPYGWLTHTIAGAVPAFRTDSGDNSRESMAAGWEVSEDAQASDTVLFQQIPCEKGRRYRLTAECRLWNPWNSREMVICGLLGIDPAGGDDPLAASVIWSSPTHRREEWTALSVAAVAGADSITVYLRGHAQYSRLMNTRFRRAVLADVTHLP